MLAGRRCEAFGEQARLGRLETDFDGARRPLVKRRRVKRNEECVVIDHAVVQFREALMGKRYVD